MKNYQQQVLEVIQKAVEQAGSQNKLALAMGTDRAKICKWLGGTSPNTKDFASLAEYVGAQIVLPGQSIRDYARLLQVEDLDALRHRNDMKAGEEVPVSVLEYVAQKKHRQPDILFSLDLLKRKELDAADALLYTMPDETMAPFISKGDLVLLNKCKRAIEDGKIFLIHRDKYFKLRKLSRRLDGTLIIQSLDNTAAHHIPSDQVDTIEIIGQVVWIGHNC